MKTVYLSVGKNHPRILALLRSQDNRQRYLRDLLRRDITDHEGIVNTPKPSKRIKAEKNPKPMNMTLTLDENRDADIIDHISGIEDRARYILGLLYFSIGEIPPDCISRVGRPPLSKEEREKNRAESLARAKQKYLSRKKRYNFFFNYRWWNNPVKGRMAIIWFDSQANKTAYLKAVIRKMIHGGPDVECDIINPISWADYGESIGFHYSDHFDLILDTEDDADIIEWFEKREGYGLKPMTIGQRSHRSFYVPTVIAMDVARGIGSTVDTEWSFNLRCLAKEWEKAESE